MRWSQFLECIKLVSFLLLVVRAQNWSSQRLWHINTVHILPGRMSVNWLHGWKFCFHHSLLPQWRIKCFLCCAFVTLWAIIIIYHGFWHSFNNKNDVYGVYRGGDHIKLSGEGSLFISWHEMSRVDVEGEIPNHFSRAFFPPDLDTDTVGKIQRYSLRTYIMKIWLWGMFIVWLDIYRDNRSIVNDIIKQTSKEIELIKNGFVPKAIHFSIWGSFGFLVILAIVLIFVCFKRKNRKKSLHFNLGITLMQFIMFYPYCSFKDA